MTTLNMHQLRCLLAAQALQGMIASAPICNRTKINKAKWAQVAFQWADALLIESTKQRRQK